MEPEKFVLHLLVGFPMLSYALLKTFNYREV
jgi:hypothetical protein